VTSETPRGDRRRRQVPPKAGADVIVTGESSRGDRRKGPAVARDLPRNEEILKIAAQVLWREGLRATVQEIGEAAGIHKASLYHYFATKQEILERICYWAAERMHPPLHEISASGSDPPTQLRRALRHYVRFLLENPAEMGLLIFEARRFDDPLAATLAKYRDTYEDWYEDVIRAGMETGHFRRSDPQLDVFLVFGMANTLLLWFNPEGRLTPDQAIESVVSSALAMLAPVDRSPA
jgi:AcrR family transcriptional regulator